MPRAARPFYVTRTYARRRHRSWMVSMTFASLGWGTWWLVLFARRFFDWSPALAVPSTISSIFAVLGLLVAVWCFRARRSWMLFVMIPFLANASLLAMPWLATELAKN